MQSPWPAALEPRRAERVAADVPDSAPTAVVLGGTGCIGRHICAAFSRQGYRVVTVTRRPAPRVAPHPHRRLDLAAAEPAALRAVFDDERADVVVNATDMAGATDATGAADGGEARAAELLDANEGLARRLVEALSAAARGPRLVHIGTIHEYGPGESGVPLHEDVEPEPANAYARAKLAGSQVVLDAARAGAVSAVVLRLVNTCGPYPTPAGFVGKLLPTLLAAAAAGEPPSITVGGAMRDWIDVRDVAEAAVLAARRPVSGHAFNIGSGVCVSMRELVGHALAAAGLPDSGVRETAGPLRSLGADWIQADIGRARALLGWSPAFRLKESMRDMWDAGETSR
ncbi:NAD-dependent epimerase/dehydratase family protein [Streptomyces sp. NPDC018059]|uniref:NAD-dependent epimerase/dehydratase family protein n=1 Tax=Streptomyces sp. NPDC018059 TaxID=3365041 RepID=UPI00379006CC